MMIDYLAEILPHFDSERERSLLMQIFKTIFEGYVQIFKDSVNKLSTGVDMSNFELDKVDHIEREANWITTSLCGNFIGSDDEFLSETSRAKSWIHDILFYNGYYDIIRILKVDKPKNVKKRDVSWLLDNPYDYSDFLKKEDYINQRKSTSPKSVSNTLNSLLNRIVDIEPVLSNYSDFAYLDI